MGATLAESASPQPAPVAAAGTLDAVATLLDQGLLAEAMAGLEGIVALERENWSSGGDRERLQQASAALAVTQSLVAAKTAVESTTAADAARHRVAATQTLSRATLITEPLRTALVKQAGLSAGPKGHPVNEPVKAAPRGYDPAIGQALAKRSAAISGGNPVAGGRCYARVADAVDVVIGSFLYGGHAYMAAAQLAAKTNLFTEVGADNLSGLPAGAIVVWGKGTSKSGHISISLGDGRESSDFVGRQMPRHYGGAPARVFLPKGRMGR